MGLYLFFFFGQKLIPDFGPLTETECFVLVKEYFLYLKLVSKNWVGYLSVSFSKAILNVFVPDFF